MADTVQKSDFVLTPYMKSNDLRATYQILNTVLPYIGLWILAPKAASISLGLLIPIICIMTLFSARCFSLMHDCGHYSLFTSKRVNRVVGFGLGVLNAIPQYPWSRGHAYHHKTNGDWERYRGPSALLSAPEFASLSSSRQKRYELLRHPAMLFPGGFFYLAIKPRLALILGSYGFIKHLFTSWQNDPDMRLRDRVTSYSSKHWYTTAEFWDLLFKDRKSVV